MARPDRRKQDEHTKELLKEAIKEWLDEKYKDVGRWTIGGFTALTVAALIFLVLWANGYRVVAH